MLNKRVISLEDFQDLLEEKNDECLEVMAQRVYKEHLSHFGKAIIFYTPMYLANYCVNQCTYCGYNAKQKIKRHQLSVEEAVKEAKAISKTGLKHILLLTGESEKHTPLDYIVEIVQAIKPYFDSIGIEIYPLTTEGYQKVIEAGVDSLTIYQEVYDYDVYEKVHPFGPKSDYAFRLGAPSRGAEAGMFSVGIGALLGLHDYKSEVLALGKHVKSLMDEYPEVYFSISVPRLRPTHGMEDVKTVDDRTLLQIILALKLFLPSVGITLSTRESEQFRNHMLGLGISKMSAGVKTSVGGHDSDAQGDHQFEIADTRSVSELKEALVERGYQPVLSDWLRF